MNYIAIVVAALVAFFLGFLWYGPLFGKTWMHLSGLNAKKLGKGKKEGIGWRMALNLVGNLVVAGVLALLIDLIGAPGITGGMEIAFWAWLGFEATLTLGGVLWEGKRWGLWLFNNTYNLIALLLMGSIIGGM